MRLEWMVGHMLASVKTILLSADMLRDEVDVSEQAVGRAFDLDDRGVVEEPVEESGRDDWIAKNVAPFGEDSVRDGDHGSFFATRVDDLEEEVGSSPGDGYRKAESGHRNPALDAGSGFVRDRNRPWPLSKGRLGPAEK